MTPFSSTSIYPLLHSAVAFDLDMGLFLSFVIVRLMRLLFNSSTDLSVMGVDRLEGSDRSRRRWGFWLFGFLSPAHQSPWTGYTSQD